VRRDSIARDTGFGRELILERNDQLRLCRIFTSDAQTPLTSSQPSSKGDLMKKNVLKFALVSAALVAAPITFGVVSAQTNPSSPAGTAAQAAVNYANVFVTKLAAALGVTEDKLKASLKTAGTATVDEALKNQDITRAQADRLKAGIEAGETPFFGGKGFGDRGFGRGGMGPRGGMFGGPGMGADFRVATLEAAAKALNMTATDLESQLRSGQTLQQIATTKNVQLKAVQDAMLAALKTQLDAEVKAGRLTQAQADAIYARAAENPNFGLGGPRWRR
jgi:hypothetical protein